MNLERKNLFFSQGFMNAYGSALFDRRHLIADPTFIIFYLDSPNFFEKPLKFPLAPLAINPIWYNKSYAILLDSGHFFLLMNEYSFIYNI